MLTRDCEGEKASKGGRLYISQERSLLPCLGYLTAAIQAVNSDA